MEATVARRHYRKMTPVQFENTRRKLGLSQVRAAKLAGYQGRTGQRWAAGERKIPESVAMLFRLMLEFGIEPDEMA